MTENEISYSIRGAAFRIYNKLGPGLLESVYEQSLIDELRKEGFIVRNQVGIPYHNGSINIDVAFRLDILVDNKVIVEVKSVEGLLPVHHKQLLTYLRLTNLKLGLLINFNTDELQKSIIRIVNNL